MRICARSSYALAAAVLLSSTVAFAQTATIDRSFNPRIWYPAPGPDRFISVEAATPLPHLGFAVGLYFNYARNTFSIYRYDPANERIAQNRAALLRTAVGADVYAALGVINRLQIGLALPMTVYQSGTTFTDINPQPGGTEVKAPNGFALGDPRLYLKVRLYGKATGAQFSLSHWLSFPFGNDKQFGGEKHFSGFAGEARALFGWDAERWRVGLFLGFLWRAHASKFFSTEISHQVTAGGAVAFDAVKKFSIILEIFGRNELTSNINNTALEVSLAGRIRPTRGLMLDLGLGTGIIKGLGSPEPRVFFGLAYARDTKDRDKDGIPDEVDKCPDYPEDKDGFEDQDGCPEADNDKDGIPDTVDKCPNQAEDFDEFQDDDGCPDPDNDGDGVDDAHDLCPADKEDKKEPAPFDGCPAEKTDTDRDGIMDKDDKCPKEPEDKDGFQDEDGCPDPDNDGDGIPDEFDQCPLKAEDMDGFEDEDGCPEPDNDKDGIPDAKDKCPNEPETINGFKDDDGCPDKGPPPKARIEKGKIVILDKVFFDTAKATIKPVSFNLLDQVAALIQTGTWKVKVEGHTDSQGKADKNIKLSQDRAASVRNYLIKKGVAAERLTAVGFGPTQPVADNKTAAGREANRRVEFTIVEEPKADAKPEGEAKPE